MPNLSCSLYVNSARQRCAGHAPPHSTAIFVSGSRILDSNRPCMLHCMGVRYCIPAAACAPQPSTQDSVQHHCKTKSHVSSTSRSKPGRVEAHNDKVSQIPMKKCSERCIAEVLSGHSMNSALLRCQQWICTRQPPRLLSRVLLCTLLMCNLYGQHVEQQIGRDITWQLRQLRQGSHLCQLHAGQILHDLLRGNECLLSSHC